MTNEELKQLEVGDIVKLNGDSRCFIVTGNYGDRAIAIAVVDITNPPEWTVIMKSDHNRVQGT